MKCFFRERPARLKASAPSNAKPEVRVVPERIKPLLTRFSPRLTINPSAAFMPSILPLVCGRHEARLRHRGLVVGRVLRVDGRPRDGHVRASGACPNASDCLRVLRRRICRGLRCGLALPAAADALRRLFWPSRLDRRERFRIDIRRTCSCSASGLARQVRVPASAAFSAGAAAAGLRCCLAADLVAVRGDAARDLHDLLRHGGRVMRPCALSRAEITSPTSTSMSSCASTSTLPCVWYSLSFFLPSSSSFSSSALL